MHKAAAIAVAAMCAWYVYRLCYLPYRCNGTKAVVERRTVAVFDKNPARARAVAERNLQWLKPCLAAFPNDLDLNLAAGANFRILDVPEVALRYYERALEVARRPEIHYNLAQTNLAAGRRAQASEHLFQAARFDPDVLVEFEDGLMRREVTARLRSAEGHPALVRRRMNMGSIGAGVPYGQDSVPLQLELQAGDLLEFVITATAPAQGARPRLIVVDGAARVVFESSLAGLTTTPTRVVHRIPNAERSARDVVLLWRNDPGAAAAIPPTTIDFTYRADPSIQY